MASRSLIVEIVGDASSLDREFKRAAGSAARFSGTVKEQAAGAITAQVGQRRELEKLAAEYKLVARNAKQGSEVQVTAAKLAANAERQLAASFGVVNAETRRSAHGFTVLHGEVGKASRGALAGSGVFRSLGRSIAFASGGFLAFATAGEFLRKSIDAAKEAQVTQKQLGAQFRAAGKDLGVYQAEIDKTANRLSLLAGFQNNELKAGFTTIFRTTGNVSKALRDLATAADLARAKHISFAQASLIIAKTEAGNTTLLRRQGFQIAKNATAEKALAQVRAVVAGQAKAGTTAQERFGAVLHNTEEIIGTALLPTLNKYLNSLAKWLTKMNESGRLQRDVEGATKALNGALQGIKAVVVPLAEAFNVFASAVGGTRNAVKLLVETVALVKLSKMISGLTGVGAAAGEAGAAGQVALLTRRLTLLGEIGLIVVTIEIVRKLVDSKTGKKFHLDYSGIDLAKDIKKGVDDVGKTSVLGFSISDMFRKEGEKQGDKASNAFADGYGKNFAGIVNKLVAKERAAAANGAQFLTQPVKDAIDEAQKRIPVFTLKPEQVLRVQGADRPDDLGVLRKQLTFDKARIAELRKRKAEGKVGAKSFTAAITAFLNDRNQTTDHINSIVKAAADAAKSKAKARTDNLNALFDSSISGALNRVQDFAIGKQVAALRTIAAQLQSRIAATKNVLRRRDLEDQLLGVIRQQKAARQQVAQNVLDSLQLNVDKSGLSKSLADDLAALLNVNAAIKAQIKATGDTTDLEQRLIANIQALKAVRQQQAQARNDARNARQFKALGLTATGDDIVPGVGALKNQLKKVDAAIEGSFLDTKKTRSLVSHLKQVLAGGLGEVGRTVRAKVQSMLDDLDNQLKGHEGDVTKFRHVSTAKLLKGLGLDPKQLRTLRLRLAVVGPGQTVPGGRQPAFAPSSGAASYHIEHLHINRPVGNPRELEDQLQKRTRSRAHIRRGA